ncbi:MAG TPA: cytochrome c family protein [Candidatus Polarisedimenticolaceae bacterium]
MRGIWLLIGAIAAIPSRAAMPQPASAEICGDCHRAIAEGWKKSAHARAMESRLFQEALRKAGEDFGTDAKKVCLGCHAPLAVKLGDFELVKKVSWEGVTCDFCHSIRSVDVSGPNPKATVEVSNLKSGPSKDSVSPAHATAYSKVHTESETCAVCHEYRNAGGFAVVTTYSEWRESPAGKGGIPCQGCHMYLVQGQVVDPRVRRESSHQVNLHEMPGSHSIEQLNKALKAWMTVKRDGNTLRVNVRLSNDGAGHYLPTGSPMRQIVLEVRAAPFGIDSMRQERKLTRALKDASGAPIQQEHVAFLKAASVASDTRLAPDETRTETFAFEVPKDTKTRVETRLYYVHSPAAGSDLARRVKFIELVQMAP